MKETKKIQIAILGYGNVGRGVETVIKNCADMELAAIFTRREPDTLRVASDTRVYSSSELFMHKDDIDVLILCGGSATDLPEQTPMAAQHFNVIDSFDTHANIPAHIAAVDASAKKGGHVAIISVGWDPGMFSLCRLYSTAILPGALPYTFWGKGVSQGHSDAIRRIEGVLDARQYTIPVDAALSSVRNGEHPTLSVRQKHTRECFVVAAENADKAKIEREIKSMPNYFDEYDTVVHFITADELAKNHAKLNHGGSVICSGTSGDNNTHVIEYSLKLDSNPEFTAGVLLAYARAAIRLQREGNSGCKTVFDIAPVYLAEKSRDEVIKSWL